MPVAGSWVVTVAAGCPPVVTVKVSARPRWNVVAFVRRDLTVRSIPSGAVPVDSDPRHVVEAGVVADEGQPRGAGPVSYTHLTLPTIYSV